MTSPGQSSQLVASSRTARGTRAWLTQPRGRGEDSRLKRALIHLALTHRAAEYGDESGEAYDFRPMFEPVRALLSDADLAICHLEVPLSPDSSVLSGYPRFSAPAELADGLAWAGFDGCSTASNHSSRAVRSHLPVSGVSSLSAWIS